MPAIWNWEHINSSNWKFLSSTISVLFIITFSGFVVALKLKFCPEHLRAEVFEEKPTFRNCSRIVHCRVAFESNWTLSNENNANFSDSLKIILTNQFSSCIDAQLTWNSIIPIFIYRAKNVQSCILVGWIPGFLGFSNSVYKTWIWLAQIVELQKSFPMIPNSNQFPGNSTSQINFLTFA